MSKRYVFVDGAHLQRHYREHMTAFFGEAPPIDFEQLLHSANAEKLFFYDSVDRLAAEALVADADAELDRINSTANCHVREGTVRAGRKRSGLEQKEVDVMLAVEMLTHGFRRNFDDAVLVTGDLDFKPAVDSLVNLGLRVEVWYVRRHGAQPLLAAADSRRELTLRDWFRWSGASFNARHADAFPRQDLISHTLSMAPKRSGHVGKRTCTLHNMSPSWALVILNFDHGRNLRVTANSPEAIEAYMPLVHDAIEWS